LGEFSISTLIYLSLEKLATDEIHFNPLVPTKSDVRRIVAKHLVVALVVYGGLRAEDSGRISAREPVDHKQKVFRWENRERYDLEYGWNHIQKWTGGGIRRFLKEFC
jgi:urease accessory protein UreH